MASRSESSGRSEERKGTRSRPAERPSSRKLVRVMRLVRGQPQVGETGLDDECRGADGDDPGSSPRTFGSRRRRPPPPARERRRGEGGSRSHRGARRGHAPLPTIEARHEAGRRRPTGHALRRERPRATGTIGRRSSAGVPVRRSVYGRGARTARPSRAERHDASLRAPFSAAHRDSGRGDVSSGPTRDACRLGQGFGLRSSCDADRSSPSWARPRRSSGARVGVRDRPRESTAAMREASVESVSAQTPCREAGRGSSPGAAARRKATPRWPADRDT